MDAEDSLAETNSCVDELYDQQDYLENHSRRNNVKIMEIPENDEITFNSKGVGATPAPNRIPQTQRTEPELLATLVTFQLFDELPFSEPSLDISEPRLPIDVSLIPREDLSQDVSTHRARLVEKLKDVQKLVKERTEKAQQRMKELHDQMAKEVNFEVGQKVFVYTPKTRKGLSKKLLHCWHGPFRIDSQENVTCTFPSENYDQ